MNLHAAASAGTTPDQTTPAFASDAIAGLTQHPKQIPPKYFYDAAGSELFEQITRLPEYYPTRTEIALLRGAAAEMAAEIPDGAALVEFGSGASVKTRVLLDAAPQVAVYAPIDISISALEAAARAIGADYPALTVAPLRDDFTNALSLPDEAQGRPVVGFFPGSTIGNFTPAEALQFLRGAARLLRGGGLLLGADLVKDPAVLHAAYNDAQGVTAAFNLNLLARANRELGTQFDLSQFAHSAFYNAALRRIEMHLVSRRRQRVEVGGECFEIAEGQNLHTENSYKFTVDSLRALAVRAGFKPGPVWTDENRLFSVHWLHAPD